jgi:hypothetical protein
MAICSMTENDPFAGFAGARGLDELTGIVSRAAAAIVAIDHAKVDWRNKSDRSPVSAADEASNAIIVQGLAHLLPGVPIVSEEEEVRPSALEAGFVLVDLDARASSWRAERSSRLTSPSSAGPCSGSSRRRPLALSGAELGSADLYARLARTCEWDVAAGHAILAAAGGIVTAPDGAELVYGHAPDFHVPGFIAWGDPSAQTTASEQGSGRSCSTARAVGQATSTKAVRHLDPDQCLPGARGLECSRSFRGQ